MKKERLILNKRIFLIKPFLYIVFLVSFASTAQNLVPNGSFEEYSTCPEQNELGNGQFERCIGWYYSTPMNVGTPDYFNVCNNSLTGVVGIPNNFWGYQQAFDGNGYVGIDVFDYQISSNEFVGAEYIETKLLIPLESCRIYRFSMRVSLANKSTHGIEKLGIVLSKDASFQNNLAEWVLLEPNWENDFALSDTANWILVEQDILSNGGEQFLKIGYFADYENNELVFNDSTIINVFGTFSPYYYVDSISLIPLGEAENCLPEFANIFSPNDDHINDTYSIKDVNVDHFLILNRWGNTLVSLDKENPIWDGTLNGEQCSEGIYFYKTEYKGIEITGFIELIR
jgi:gliding motility-associated-like protein